ncbi:MAG: AAA family ATPase [Deltaproteobacteria bacterium]|nr:AAA family ATPase [Deltaproteobacteria bacterium]
MSYYKLLELNSEPFSNSPEPDLFYQAPQYVQCLQKLEISIRLRRGLNVVVGDVGTGKTTLSRMLIRKFRGEGNVEMYLVLDPDFSSALEFLVAVARMFGVYTSEAASSEWRLKENIKDYLFHQGIHKDRVVVLIIDEGQKLPPFCIELLREFLNYETNTSKLLQIVLFAQREFKKILDEHANFADRVNFYYVMKPLSFSQTRAMIRFRIDKVSEAGKNPILFTSPALWAIYRATGGYPRKIMMLGHQILLKMIVQDQKRADWSLVRSCIKAAAPGRPVVKTWRLALVPACIAFAALVLGLTFEKPSTWLTRKMQQSGIAALQREDAASLQSSVISPATSSSMPAADGNPAGQEIREASLENSNQEPRENKAGPSARLSVDMPSVPIPPPSVESMRGKEMPESLGQLTMKKRSSCRQILQQLYGSSADVHIESLSKANLKIKDINKVQAGDAVRFPALPASSRPDQHAAYWVQLAEMETLEDAYEYIHHYTVHVARTRILPFWSREEGLRFSILLEEGFNHEKSARKAVKSLPQKIATSAKIVSEWGEGTVFFADLG